MCFIVFLSLFLLNCHANLLLLRLATIFAGDDLCQLHEFCVAAVRCFTCLGMFSYYFGLPTFSLSVSLLDYFFLLV